MTLSLSILGMARKAGRLEIGEENAGSAARAKKAKAILSASDASDNALHRARNFSAAGGVPHIILPFSKSELGMAVGKGAPATLAVTDIGLAANFAQRLTSEYPDMYDEAAEMLSQKAERALRRKRETAVHDRNAKMGKRRKK